jgi:hypothetical protein
MTKTQRDRIHLLEKKLGAEKLVNAEHRRRMLRNRRFARRIVRGR